MMMRVMMVMMSMMVGKPVTTSAMTLTIALAAESGADSPAEPPRSQQPQQLQQQPQQPPPSQQPLARGRRRGRRACSQRRYSPTAGRTGRPSAADPSTAGTTPEMSARAAPGRRCCYGEAGKEARREVDAKGLPHRVAGALPAAVFLGKHRQRPAVHGNVLRRRQKIECEKDNGEKEHVRALRVQRALNHRRESDQQNANQQLERNHPRLPPSDLFAPTKHNRRGE